MIEIDPYVLEPGVNPAVEPREMHLYEAVELFHTMRNQGNFIPKQVVDVIEVHARDKGVSPLDLVFAGVTQVSYDPRRLSALEDSV